MTGAILALVPAAFLLSFILTRFARALGHRLSAHDAPGVPGQVKAPTRRVPNTGGIAIFWAFALPMAGLLLALSTGQIEPNDWNLVPADLHDHLPGIADKAPAAWILLACLFALHMVGLIDDRKPLPAAPKLIFMLALAGLASWLTDTRLLTALDPLFNGWGVLISIAVTIVWFVVVTNAFNFLDNMDGLSPGVAMLCASFFLASTLNSPQPQWFVAACLALLVGSLLGFLCYNFPFTKRGASIFQGDSGSLVVGFLLAFLSTRLTYLPVDPAAGAEGADVMKGPLAALSNSPALPALFTPLVILAIPLYDFFSVTAIRLSQGKSPFVGDLQHFSHRLVNHGLTRRAAVLVIYGCTIVTAIGGLLLPALTPRQSILIAIQTACVLGVLAAYEWARQPPPGGRRQRVG